MTVAIATGYFAAFVVLHVVIVLFSRRLDATPPRQAATRTRLARRLGLLLVSKAAWFAVLFAVAAATVVTATPNLPLIEVILVYGGIIGIVTSLMQAADWYATARRIRIAAVAIETLAMGPGGLVEDVNASDLVAVQLPRAVLERLRRDGHVGVDDVVISEQYDRQETAP